MSDKFNFEVPPSGDPKKEDAKWQEILIDEILYEWPEELRIEQYRLLVGQKPKLGMTDRHIAESIIDPEKERMRIVAESREEDKDDIRRTYPKRK